MTITYYFDDEPYEYEVEETLRDFIEEVIPFEEQVKLYIDEIYSKDADERDLMYQDFGIKSKTEMNDFLWDEGADWIADSLSDNIESLIYKLYYDELKDYYQEDALEEFSDTIPIEDIHDEWERDYWRSRV